MSALTGTLTLARFIVRRDRIRISVWVGAIAALAALTAVGIEGVFPTQAALDQTAAATAHNAAMIAFNGAPYALDTIGGQVAFQFGAGGMVLVALMSLFMTGRLTRGEEEGGRLELVRSLPVGIHANTIAAVLVVASMGIAVGALSAAALIAQGLPVAGSATLGASFTLVALVFAGVALLAAQAAESTRFVYGASAVVLGAAYVLRAVGDIGDGTADWLTPIGIAEQARPFAGERWWPFALLVGLAAVLILASTAIAARRDLGAGLIAVRPGPPTAAPSLGSPLGLALRLQRGSLQAWAAGVFVIGAFYGLLGPSVDAFIAGNKMLAELLASGGGGTLTDQYFADSFRLMALLASGFAVQSALRIRGEETALRADLVLATPVSRVRFAAGHLAPAIVGSVLLLALVGLGTGLAYGLAGGDAASLPALFAAPIVYAPAMWVMAGLAVALDGLAPRWVDATWVLLVGCVVVGFLGPVLGLPPWVNDLSPFQHVPELPGGDLALAPLVALSALAAGLTAVGLVGLRRRDIGRV